MTLLRQALWDPADKSMVLTEVPSTHSHSATCPQKDEASMGRSLPAALMKFLQGVQITSCSSQRSSARHHRSQALGDSPLRRQATGAALRQADWRAVYLSDQRRTDLLLGLHNDDARIVNSFLLPPRSRAAGGDARRAQAARYDTDSRILTCARARPARCVPTSRRP